MNNQLGQALNIFPNVVREAAFEFANRTNLCIEEVRLRAGRPATVYANKREWKLLYHGDNIIPNQQIIAQVVTCASDFSIYNTQEQLARGFCTIKGGHRLGICGESVCENGHISTLKNFSSVNLRIAHEILGTAEPIINLIWKNPASVLIIGAPGCGKTTVLRDTVRQLSDRLHYNVSLVDERWEVAAAVNGVPQFDVGCVTDVISGAPKQQAVPLLLRTMRPEWIALDEITEYSDLCTIFESANCGVRIIATAHADSMQELKCRPIYQKMLNRQVFGHFVRIDHDRNLHEERI